MDPFDWCLSTTRNVERRFSLHSSESSTSILYETTTLRRYFKGFHPQTPSMTHDFFGQGPPRQVTSSSFDPFGVWPRRCQSLWHTISSDHSPRVVLGLFSISLTSFGLRRRRPQRHHLERWLFLFGVQRSTVVTNFPGWVQVKVSCSVLLITYRFLLN